MEKEKPIGIIGYGGLAREIACRLSLPYKFFVLDSEFDTYDKNQNIVLPLSNFDSNIYQALVAIGNPITRYNVINNELPKDVDFYTFIDPNSHILDKNTIKINKGTMICCGAILTTNIIIGEHCLLNPNTTIGHDTVIGDYCTLSPGVNIAGNCNIGKRNFFGIASSMKEKITTCDDVIFGLNCGIIKNICQIGTYIGTPAKLLTIK